MADRRPSFANISNTLLKINDFGIRSYDGVHGQETESTPRRLRSVAASPANAEEPHAARVSGADWHPAANNCALGEDREARGAQRDSDLGKGLGNRRQRIAAAEGVVYKTFEPQVSVYSSAYLAERFFNTTVFCAQHFL